MEFKEVLGRIDSLSRYRKDLDESEREIFDMLIGYANEVVKKVDIMKVEMSVQTY